MTGQSDHLRAPASVQTGSSPSDSPLTVTQALQQAAALSLERLTAQWLLLHVLGRRREERAWLLSNDDALLSREQGLAWQQALLRAKAGEPLAYITGERGFYGLTLHVDARVLDPRPDTETLVDWALQLMQGWPSPCVLDAGTGSGAVALALQSQCASAQVWALDVSADALDVARANADRLQLPVRFVQSDWLAQWPSSAPPHFDLIASNPPYIEAGDPHLQALCHEPTLALVSGTDGLTAIHTLIAQAPARLKPGGWLLIEHGWQQAPAVRELLRAAGFGQVQSRSDLAGIARCSGGQWVSAGC